MAHLPGNQCGQDEGENGRAWSKGSNPLADPEERQVIFAALDSFHQYRKNAHYNITHRRRQNLYALPNSQWKLLSEPPFDLLNVLNAVDDAIDCNADLAEEIMNLGVVSFGLPDAPEKGTPSYWEDTAKPGDIAKAHSTIRQFYRDWSAEGYQAEVRPLLEHILADLEAANLQSRKQDIGTTVLVPGAGLGRILFELCLAGYTATGNEISYHQLIASNFILNTTQYVNQFQLYPFATTFTNNLSRTDQLRQVSIPDTHPASALNQAIQQGRRVGEMSMTAGDFVLSYSTPDQVSTFDSVVTVFFIDTAPNLIRYIQTVHNCLKPNGVWINIGPLLWHFDDRVHGRDNNDDTSTTEDISTQQNQQPRQKKPLHLNSDDDEDNGIAEPGSFELTNDEVLLLVQKLGFTIEKHEIIPPDGPPASDTTTPAVSNNDTSYHKPTPRSGSGFGGGDGHGHGHGYGYGYGYGYIQAPTSMLQNTYRCSHWVARKTG